MASRTVDHSRADAVVRRIAALDGAPARLEAVALGLVDGVLAGDGKTLAAALDALRDARARTSGDERLTGWLDAAIAFAHWGLERVPSGAVVAQNTHAHDFLRALDGPLQLASAELRGRLGVDETQVSRIGRRLLEGGLVMRRKAGREVFWQLAPRGRQALAQAPAAARSRNRDFWQEAIRRGFTAAGGDEPGVARPVDPTRERIVRCTLELHKRRGIQATTWPDIAAAAGVSMDTMQALFPTQDDLVRSCGTHLMESLRLPPTDRAPDVFAGAASAQERIRRLVETCFGAYERGGDAIAIGRRERKHVPVVDETLDALDATLDALVVEALRPLAAESSSFPSVRALTDLEVWRALREQGAAPAAAVDQASAAVDRWLAAQPAG